MDEPIEEQKTIICDLIEGDITPENVHEVADVLKEFLNDPRCDGFDGLEAD
jgi:hypothetical protein